MEGNRSNVPDMPVAERGANGVLEFIDLLLWPIGKFLDGRLENFLRSAHATDPSIAKFFRIFREIFVDNVKPKFQK